MCSSSWRLQGPPGVQRAPSTHSGQRPHAHCSVCRTSARHAWPRPLHTPIALKHARPRPLTTPTNAKAKPPPHTHHMLTRAAKAPPLPRPQHKRSTLTAVKATPPLRPRHTLTMSIAAEIPPLPHLHHNLTTPTAVRAPPCPLFRLNAALRDVNPAPSSRASSVALLEFSLELSQELSTRSVRTAVVVLAVTFTPFSRSLMTC